MKKVYILLLTIIVFMTMISCDSKSGENNAKNKMINHKIGVLLEQGNMDNQKIIDTLNKGKENLNVNYDAVICAEDEEYEKNIESFAKGNYSLIIGTSQECRWSIEKMAIKYPNIKFLIIDSVIDSDNVQSIIFKENEGAYLLGIIAGMTSDTNEIAFIGGKNISLINQLEIGFASGVYSVNKEAGIKLIKKDNVEYLNSFIDVNKAYRITDNFINKSCDIIYTATRGAKLGVYTCVNERKEKGKDIFIIGESIENEDLKTDFKGLNIATLEKKIDSVIYSAIEELSKNEFSTGKIYQIGIIDEGIDIKNSKNVIIKDEIVNIINEKKKNIINGNITVPDNYEELLKQITEDRE
ncbi:BMP family lipoprotein [Oceanirhabdus seepicola]|uniref:BMP family ABC transporter substrate-binding protein n=1 Tax=Oceanirhabdus seepicola TaxID=2828781 RepID=A0A9J6NXT7_9CLOT|nr:BMP family ABC transporter substrate-binding protein [Oceanirhabdus seepicola]MCM1988445.1 BMP family ABC transporter substrate-binding protein [Oceanirhabdus seepicola]